MKEGKNSKVLIGEYPDCICVVVGDDLIHAAELSSDIAFCRRNVTGPAFQKNKITCPRCISELAKRKKKQ